MRRKEMEQFIQDIINKVEVVEYVDSTEEGNIYIDSFAKQFLKEYSGIVSREKMKELTAFIKKLV